MFTMYFIYSFLTNMFQPKLYNFKLLWSDNTTNHICTLVFLW
jgi:hypothetical protein